MKLRLGATVLVATAIAVSAPVVALREAPAQSGESVCPDFTTGHLDPAGTYTAPEGKLISAVCVKAGSDEQGDGPEITNYDPPVESVTISHSSGHDVSHFSVLLIDEPEPTTTTASPTTTSPTTTTSSPPTTTTSSSTSTTTSTSSIPSTTSSSSVPTPGQFSFSAVTATCPEGEPLINITFPNRPELNGQTGELIARDSFGDIVLTIDLTFIAGATVQVPYPPTIDDVVLTYTLGVETANAEVAFPSEEGCAPTSTTTTTPGATTTTLPASQFAFGAAASVCVAEVPTIRISFANTFPELAGQEGTLTMSDVNGNVVSTQPLVYQPGVVVDLLYPGTSVNADGSIADVPGWILNDDGFWVRDPSDEFLREGIDLSYTVNPTATASIEYPPESSTCANPDGPFPPGVTPPPGTPGTPGAPGAPGTPGLPPTK